MGFFFLSIITIYNDCIAKGYVVQYLWAGNKNVKFWVMLV